MKRKILLLLAGLFLFAGSLQAQNTAGAKAYRILIKGGTVVDERGSTSIPAKAGISPILHNVLVILAKARTSSQKYALSGDGRYKMICIQDN